MRVNQKDAERVAAKYLDRLLDERYGTEGCTIDEARSTVAELCDRIGKPGAIAVSDDPASGAVIFRLTDPTLAAYLAAY